MEIQPYKKNNQAKLCIEDDKRHLANQKQISNLVESWKKSQSRQTYESLFHYLCDCLKHNLLDLDLFPYKESKNNYQKYVIYNHPQVESFPFCLTLIVLASGQKTPIHSHKVDCAPICIQGSISEILYEDLNGLKEIRRSLYNKNQGAFLSCQEPNIHFLENKASKKSISMHLYGFDAQKKCNGDTPSSVLTVYDDEG